MRRLICADRLLVDADGEMIGRGGVLIEDELIVEAGRLSDLDVDSAVDKIDLGNATLLPGLFDCHVHLAFDPDSGTTSTKIELSDEETLDLMRANATRLLDAGITTARDLGSPGTLANIVRDEIDAGVIRGPRLQVAHAPLTVPGGHAHAMGGEVKGVDEIRSAVRQRAEQGADVIKVMATGGFMTAGTHPWQARFTVEEMRAAVEEAHKCGLLTTTHALGVEGISRAVEAGFDAIEHCGWVVENGTKFDERIASEIVRKGIYVSPTMNSACMREHYFCPWDTYESVLSNLKSMREADIEVIAGTDAGIGLVRFERFVDCLEVLSEAGFGTRALLASATSTAAAATGLSAQTGALRAGLRADVVGVRGNPLSDWRALGRIKFVMANGVPYDPRPISPFAGDEGELKRIQTTLAQGAGRKTKEHR